MNICQNFLDLEEYYAAGLFETPSRSLFYRKALGLRRYFEHVPVPEYTGKALYPSGLLPANGSVTPQYMNMNVDWSTLEGKSPALAEALKADFFRYHSVVPADHTVAGDMWNHSMPDFENVLREGLDGFEARAAKMADPELREGLLQLLAGIRNYHSRCLEYLCRVGADPKLIEAMEQVPFKPCQDIYQAVQCWNFILYLDGCDNLGSLACGLMPWYRGEDIQPLLENLFDNLDENGGYSMSLGMENNPLVVQCLRASPGKRRPMIELFVDEDTPEEVWSAALDCVRSGNGQPAFYNKKLYRRNFLRRFPHLREEDLSRMCGAGCTEMLIAGLSNVGSLDAGINLLLILEQTMDKSLAKAESFDQFYESYLEAIHAVALEVMDKISQSQKNRAEFCPVPMRTLLTGDCIARETEYNYGGARYCWSIINYAGIVNALDSLLVLRDRVFREGKETGWEFLEKLRANDPGFQKLLRTHPHRIGLDETETNALARDFTHRIFAFMEEKTPWLGGAFLPSSIQFMSYGDAGRYIGATPCGRMAGEALADSLSSVFGKDSQGPTAMLKSVTAMDLSNALGTPVVNLTVNVQQDPGILRSLISGYIGLGGMQLQITCHSREELLDAYEHPEDHKNLVVRVGGYSEYFCRLSDTLRKKVLERTVHL